MKEKITILLFTIMCSSVVCAFPTIQDRFDTPISLGAQTSLQYFSFKSEPNSDNIVKLKQPDGKTILDRAIITFKWVEEGIGKTFILQNEGANENIVTNTASTQIEYTIEIECKTCSDGSYVSFTIHMFNEIRNIPITNDSYETTITSLYKSKESHLI